MKLSKVPHSHNGRNASLKVFIAALKGLRLFGPEAEQLPTELLPMI